MQVRTELYYICTYNFDTNVISEKIVFEKDLYTILYIICMTSYEHNAWDNALKCSKCLFYFSSYCFA